jgi:hypothetical protein
MSRKTMCYLPLMFFEKKPLLPMEKEEEKKGKKTHI